MRMLKHQHSIILCSKYLCRSGPWTAVSNRAEALAQSLDYVLLSDNDLPAMKGTNLMY